MSEISDVFKDVGRMMQQRLSKLDADRDVGANNTRALFNRVTALESEIDKLWQHVNGAPGEEWMKEVDAHLIALLENRCDSRLVKAACRLDVHDQRLDALEDNARCPDKPTPTPCCARCDERECDLCRLATREGMGSCVVSGFVDNDVRYRGQPLHPTWCPLLKATP